MQRLAWFSYRPRWSGWAGCGPPSSCGRWRACRCCRSTTPRRPPMAKSHTTEDGYTNPEVRFERSDVEIPKVVRFASVLALVLAVSAVFAIVIGWRLTRDQNRIKATDLPPAAIDREPGAHLPPEPRLESIDDVRERDRKNISLFPPRAGGYLKREKEELEKGNPADGVEPIAESMTQLAGKLPARKQPPPTTFGVTLPSKSSSGRATTGGQ